MLRKDQGQ